MHFTPPPTSGSTLVAERWREAGRTTPEDRAFNEAHGITEAWSRQPTLSETWGTAREHEDIILNWGREHTMLRDFEDDPDFAEQMTEEFAARLMRGIPKERADYIAQANSVGEALARRRLLLDALGREQELAEAGWTGVAASMGAAAVDPVGIIGGVLTGPLGWSAKAGRAANIARGALTAGASNAALEAALVSYKPTGDWRDVAMSATLGMALGGALGAVAGPGSRALDAPAAPSHAPSVSPTSAIDTARASASAKVQRSVADLLESQTIASRLNVEAGYISQAIKDFKTHVRTLQESIETLRGERAESLGGMSTKLSRKERKSPLREKADLEHKLQQVREPANTDIARHLDNLRRDPLHAKTPARKLKELARRASRAEYDQELQRLREALGVVDQRPEAEVPGRAAEAEMSRWEQNPETVQQLTVKQQQLKDLLGPQKDAWIKQRVEELRGAAESLRPTTRTVDLGEMPHALQLAARLPKEATEAAPARDLMDSVGAMRIEGHTKDIHDDLADALEAAADAPRSALTHLFGIPLRFDAVGQLGSSKLSLSRLWGFRLAQESVGTADGRVLEESATEWQTRIARHFEIRFQRGYVPAYQAWLKETYGETDWGSLRPFKEIQRQQEFGEAVTRAIRTGTSPSKSVEQAASLLRSLYEDHVNLSRNTGHLEGRQGATVPGFENVLPDPFYFPRVLSPGKWQGAMQSYRADQIAKLYAGAIRAAHPTIAEVEARLIADSMVKKMRMDQMGMEVPNARAALGEDIDGFRSMLTEAGVPQDTIDALVKRLETPPTTTAAHPRGRRRAVLDEDFQMELRNMDTGQMEMVRIAELWDNDAANVFLMYNRQMTGQQALTRVGLKSQADFEKLKNLIRDEAGDSAEGKRQAQRDIKNLEYLYKSIAGIPLHDVNTWQHGLSQMVMKYNFVRVMNQAGFAQLSELGNNLMELGFFNAIRSMPTLDSLRRFAANGKIKDELADEMELFTGLGGDLIRSRTRTLDDQGNPYFLQSQSKFVRGMDTLLNAGRRITLHASMGPVNTYLHRMTQRSIAHRFHRLATGKADVKSFRSILRHSGLTDGELQGIFEQIRKHAKPVEGSITGRLQKLDIENWDDPFLAERFAAAAFRIGQTIISEPDAGNLHRLFGGMVGKILFQFRTFMFLSHAKHFLRHINYSHWRNYSAMMASMVAGGLGYAAQTVLKSIGRPDQERYLEERLSMENWSKAAFQRSSWSGFTPLIIDQLAVGGAVFDYRSSGLATSGVFSNPSGDTFNSLFSIKDAIMGATGILPNYRYSRENHQAILRALPFANMAGIENILQMTGQDLPRYSQ